MRTARLVIVVVALLTGWLTVAPASAAPVTCNGQRATIVGTEHDDVLAGTSHRDVIAGQGGSDRINGLGGDDLVCGGYGADHLYGGTGADRLNGGPDRIIVTDEETERLGDVLQGGSGDDALAPGSDLRPADDITPDVLSWHAATRPVTVDISRGTAVGAGHDDFDATHASVVGSPYGDTILGSSAADTIYAGSGPDVVRARGGDDRVRDDAINDTPGPNADVIRGGPGADELSVTFGRDTVYSGFGNDFVDDLDNNVDAIYGGEGDDHIVGEITTAGGTQRYSGGPGADAVGLSTYLANPTASAATGNWDMATGSVVYQLDHLVGMIAEQFEAGDLTTFGATWTVDGSPLDDTVSAAGTSGTTFHGLDGDDAFMGSAYDDVFDGGPGTDRSLGMGDGNDACINVELFDDATCESAGQ